MLGTLKTDFLVFFDVVDIACDQCSYVDCFYEIFDQENTLTPELFDTLVKNDCY